MNIVNTSDTCYPLMATHQRLCEAVADLRRIRETGGQAYGTDFWGIEAERHVENEICQARADYRITRSAHERAMGRA